MQFSAPGSETSNSRAEPLSLKSTRQPSPSASTASCVIVWSALVNERTSSGGPAGSGREKSDFRKLTIVLPAAPPSFRCRTQHAFRHDAHEVAAEIRRSAGVRYRAALGGGDLRRA